MPREVWALGFVSLCMDLSSELIHSILPLFLVGTLGASAFTVGLIEGVAEATSQIVKIFSGALSDFVGRRKGLLLAGYGLSALSKPLFPLAGSAATVFVARFCDRVGKGIRGAPRDALVADVTPPQIRGAAFGLRQAMDTVGALLGPALAIVLLVALRVDLHRAMWVAVIPALACVIVILVAVREPVRSPGTHRLVSPIHPRELKSFGRSYWVVVMLGLVFTLARSSEAFLVLRGQQSGLDGGWAPLVMVVMSGTYAATAYPAGKLSDRYPRLTMLGVSLLPLIASELLLALVPSVTGVLSAVALWGVHLGFSQGVMSALVADTTPKSLKGTAFGVFNLVGGLAMLAANAVAGWLWLHHGAGSAFLVGSGIAGLTLGLVMSVRRSIRTPG